MKGPGRAGSPEHHKDLSQSSSASSSASPGPSPGPSPKPGKVYLVGAGPGDPGLMTLRGAELIAKADSIVYDYLASPDFLSLAKPQAELVYAGKIGSHHAMPQEEISRLLVTLGKSGKIVVRLKGGDPYVFGRGGEEALALFNEGVPFEVVPGVSSAVAAPAAAGIPLTHRDLSSQVCIMTGHEKPGKESSAHDFAALAKMGTLSIVMGAKNLKTIADSLIKAGKPPSTPAAMIEWGHTPRQRAVSAPLSELSAAAEREGLGPPSVLVVGEVVRLRESLSWYERRPLFGRKILVTRTRTQASELSKLLTELGAEAIEKPVIEIKPLEPEKALAGAFQKLARYSWLILTSPNGASIFMEALLGLGFDSRSLGGLKIAAIGPGTAQALGRFGLKPDLLPRAFVAEGLVAAFEGLNEKDKGLCLLPRAEAARDALPEGLFKLGYEVEAVPIYRAVKASWGDSNFSKELLASPPDLTTLTSSSTAEGLADLIEPQCRHLLPVASIGPVTTSAAKSLGFFVAVESPASTIPALAGAIFSSLSGKGA